MTNPRVSVLIPTYRRPWFLRDAIGSVLTQRNVELEIIVGDDGRQGRQVVAEFADSRVSYIAHASRRGLAGNWNFLLTAARGRYMALLMDDDRYLPGFLERTVTAMEADPDIGVAFSNHLFERDGYQWPRLSLVPPGTHHHFASAVIGANPVPISASVIRRTIWEQVGPLPDTGAADLVLFGRIADRGWAFHYIDMPLMVYRTHPAAYSADPSFRADVVRAWEHLSFSDPDADAARVCRLADALVGRAAMHVQLGDLRSARRDLARSRTLGLPWSPKTVLLESAARVPLVGRVGYAAKRASKRWVRRSPEQGEGP